MQTTAAGTRRVIRRVAGAPVASVRVPSWLPLLLDRHQARFDRISLPPLPVPLLLVHTAGKPMDYRSCAGDTPGHSLPGLMTFVPRNVRAEVSLRGVGEGTVVHFDAATATMPDWLMRTAWREPFTHSNDVIVAIVRRLTAPDMAAAAPSRHSRALGNALVSELQRELSRQRTTHVTPPTRGGLHVAHAAIRYMRAQLGEPLAVSDVAAACGIGTTTLTARFREATGTSPHRYLRQARIERACNLLRGTALSVREIAEAVGFRGQGHFCTAFVAECGLTPTAYRRTSRGERALL